MQDNYEYRITTSHVPKHRTLVSFLIFRNGAGLHLRLVAFIVSGEFNQVTFL